MTLSVSYVVVHGCYITPNTRAERGNLITDALVLQVNNRCCAGPTGPNTQALVFAHRLDMR